MLVRIQPCPPKRKKLEMSIQVTHKNRELSIKVCSEGIPIWKTTWLIFNPRGDGSWGHRKFNADDKSTFLDGKFNNLDEIEEYAERFCMDTKTVRNEELIEEIHRIRSQGAQKNE